MLAPPRPRFRARALAGRTHRRPGACDRASRWLLCAALGLLPPVAAATVAGSLRTAAAAPIRGTGEAKASEWKQAPDATVVRARALRRARTAAITAALDAIAGVDKAQRKAVLSSHESWSSAYRIVDETRSGEVVRVEIEVEVDLPRLTKRVGIAAGGDSAVRPRFTVGAIKGSASGACGEPAALVAAVTDELVALGAVTKVAGTGTVPVDVMVNCDRLGPVRYTHMHAARIEVIAATPAHAVATVVREAFADDDDAAIHSGLSAALFAVGARLADHQRGRMTLRIETPGRGDRVRRLERAIGDDVAGVKAVRVSGLAPGAVLLTLDTELSAELLAKRLSALSLPDFSVTILATEEPDAVTIALH